MAQNTIYYPMGGSEAEAINCNYELPIGSLIPWVCPYDENRAEVEVTAIPSGYLECNGQQVVITDYLELYKVIGTKYNLSTDSDTSKFRVPDLRGRVIESRGEDMANKDGTTGTSALGKQFEGGLPNIKGYIDNNFMGVFAKSGGFSGMVSANQNNPAQRATENAGQLNLFATGLNLDASKGQYNPNTSSPVSQANSIFGKSSTVQPKSMVVIYLIKAKADISVNTTDEVESSEWELIYESATTETAGEKSLILGKKFSDYDSHRVLMIQNGNNEKLTYETTSDIKTLSSTECIRVYSTESIYENVYPLSDTTFRVSKGNYARGMGLKIYGKKKPKVLVTNEISTEIKLEQKHLVPSSTSTYQFKNDFFLTKVDDYYPVFYSNEEWKGDVWECYIVKNNGVNTNTLQVKLSKALGATDKLWVKFIKMTEV